MKLSNNDEGLQYESLQIDPSEPFKGDVFGNRKKLALQLIQYIDRLPKGCVISINSKWGNGKTWFATNLANFLHNEGRKAIYVNAFSRDYIDDPFVMISGELAPHFKSRDEGFKKRASAVLKTLAVPAMRLAIGSVGVPLFSDLLAEDNAGSIKKIGKIISNTMNLDLVEQLDKYEEQKKVVDSFKDLLELESANEPNPIVVIVDELDRCRPDFAIKTIERIKHFFDVKNLVFILMVNKHQLEAGIKGMYGEEVEAAEYLSKFIQLSLNLPRSSLDNNRGDFHQYCMAVSENLGLNARAERFNHAFPVLAKNFQLSLREIERGYALCALASNINELGELLAWIVIIKLKYPTTFNGLMLGSIDAHGQALTYLSGEKISGLGDLYVVISDLHKMQSSGIQLTGPTNQYLMRNSYWRTQSDKLIPYICKSIDFSVE